jgi:hypothetical protein
MECPALPLGKALTADGHQSEGLWAHRACWEDGGPAQDTPWLRRGGVDASGEIAAFQSGVWLLIRRLEQRGQGGPDKTVPLRPEPVLAFTREVEITHGRFLRRDAPSALEYTASDVLR